jgi:uncharacterized protein with ParB-like and HNH nuclease domain
MKLASSQRTVRQVLKANFFFIPRFQRPYSWTKENVEELWEDAIQESSGEYFIGSMVVYPHGHDAVAVVDGQQRLATLMMFLCALRDAAEANGAKKLANGTHTFIERSDENDEPRFILKTETSYPFLQDQILSRGDPQLKVKIGREEADIVAAFDRVNEYIDDLTATVRDDPLIPDEKRDEELEKKLKDVRDKILDLLLIFIEVGDRDEATTIFVTLNSRGKDLEPADLVKAHLLQLMPSKGGLDQPLERWQAIVEKFDQSQAPLNMTAFLQAVWRSRYESVTEKNLVRRIRRTIRKSQSENFLKELEFDAELYRQIEEPDYRKWKKSERDAKESLYFFGSFNIAQPMPLLLSLMREFQSKQISVRQVGRCFKAVEDYHFTYNVLASKTSSGGMSMFYARRARELLNAKSKAARDRAIDDLVVSLREKRPPDVEFDEAFADLWLSGSVTADRKMIRYILRRIYQHHHPKAAIDFGKMTIEHLAPQSKGGDAYGRIGNMIYVDQSVNEKLSNRGFKAKLEILRNLDHQWVPGDVLEASSWTESRILKRTRAMAKEARTQIWSG